MTVYVDDMFKYPMGEFRRTPTSRLMKMSHLIADTEEELHAFAAKLGLKREWWQGDHYDIAKGVRAEAVKLGAIEITLEQCSAMTMIRRTGDPTAPLAKPEDAVRLRAEERASRSKEPAADA